MNYRIKTILLSALLILSLNFYSCNTVVQQSDTRIEDMNIIELDQKIKKLTSAIRRYPASHEAYLARGAEYMYQDRYKLAISDVDTALLLKPDFHEAFFLRGTTQYIQKNWNLAIKDFDKTIELKSTDDKAYFIRGMAHMENEAFDQALKDFDMAIKLEPDFAESYYQRAYTLYILSNNDQRAINDLDRAIKLEPSIYYFYELRSVLQTRVGKDDLAKKDHNIAKNLKDKKIRNDKGSKLSKP